MAELDCIPDPKSRKRSDNIARASAAHKRCSRCGLVKQKSEFGVARERVDGVKPYCRHCHNERNKESRQRNPESSARSSANWQRNNPEKAAEKRARFLARQDEDYAARAQRRWKDRNPDAYRQSQLRAVAKRSKSLDHRFRKSFGEAVRFSFANGKERTGVFRLLGYSFEELKSHLERQFLPGMSWENRSEWHIDHIIPLSAFNINGCDDHFLRAWSLPNLRPLWAKENLKKSKKIQTLL